MSCVIFPRSIGPVVIDVVVSEKPVAGMEIPEHPVERGAKISDHAWRLPKRLELEVASQDLTGTWGALNALMEQAEPFDILTGFDLFENMMIVSIEPQRDAAWSRAFYGSVDLKEVIIVDSQGGAGNIGTGGDPRGQGISARGPVQALVVDIASAAGAAIAARIPPLPGASAIVSVF